ncbi:unnamed protein product [Trichobilharzia szidati]|nr:unnamed protein product [Trichobilharzia szidati]
MCDKPFFYNPDIDTKIAGLYDLQHTIGRGHYAVVKQARHVFTGEKVAVKVIDKTKLDNISRDHLFQEVVCMKLVQHPNVVRLYEVIDTPTKLYLVLELGDGGDLYDYITSHGDGLSEKVAKRYFRQIVTAIAYCHKLRVVHRDLKPENVVFFEKLGLVKLTDFGFSNRFIPGTNLDTACGSLAYSAPEILLGDSYDAPKVDIWSLGVILYMLVSGNLPFQETNDSETLTKIMDCDYSMPAHLSPDCKRLISRLLIRDPQKRAHLDDILQDDWLKIDGEDLPIELFSVPLISREHLSFEDHMEILSKMAEGKLATVEEIQSTLDRNEYNHIAATYYLLAERKLKRNYIEEYKRLVNQSQLIEKRKQQEQQKCINCPYTLSENSKQPQIVENTTSTKSLLNNVISSGGAGTSSRILGPLGSSNVEDRVRRFSMILEDEEEEEEGKGSPVASSLFGKCIGGVNESTNGLGDSDGLPHCLADTSEEAMLEEEEEELATVAGLVCVRSELLTEQMANNLLSVSESEYLPNVNGSVAPTRSCSRTSGSGAEVSDGAESDASLSPWSAGGFINSINRVTSTTRSLPPVDIRRKHPYRRAFISHRPLTTVKSSPQLLKHIAEEDWNSCNSFEINEPLHLDKRRKKIDECRAQNPSAYSTAEDGTGNRSLRGSCNLYRSIRYVDDQLIGLKPASLSNAANQQTYSGAHSPAWTRRFFNTPASSSRPASIGSWNAVLNMSLASEQRRPSFSSSPAENQTSGVSRRKVLYLNHGQSSHLLNRSITADRRCSGPPGLLLAVSGMYHLGSTAPLPSRCGSDTSFLDHNDSNALPAAVENSFPAEDSSGFLDGVDLSNGIRSPDTIKEASDLTRINFRYPTSSVSGVNKRGSTISPHRALCNSRRAASWCSSAPILCETSEHPYLTYVASNGSGITTLSSCENNCQLNGSSAIREHCTPIREEDDEAARCGESPISKVSDFFVSLNNRRRSESSSMQTNSAIFTASNIARVAFATLAESESTSTISQLPNIGSQQNHSGDNVPNGSNSQCTTSNFSLSSLATSLRDSRYMIDIIRGTFELQCQYNRRFTNSIVGVNSGEYNSDRTSTSTSVRSLTAISESFPINSHFKDDSQKHSTYNRNLSLLSPGSVSTSSSINQSVYSNSHTVTYPMNASCSADSFVTNSIHSTRMSLPSNLLTGGGGGSVANTEVIPSISPVLESNAENFSSSFSIEQNSPVRIENFNNHNHGNGSCKSTSNHSGNLLKHPSNLSSSVESTKNIQPSCLSDNYCSIVPNNIGQQANNSSRNNSNDNSNNSNNNMNNTEVISEPCNHWMQKTNGPNHKQLAPFIFGKHRARLACCSVS